MKLTKDEEILTLLEQLAKADQLPGDNYELAEHCRMLSAEAKRLIGKYNLQPCIDKAVQRD